MRNLFTAYRVLAMVVGVLLTVLVFVAMPLKYLTTDGTSLQLNGDHLTTLRRGRARLDLHGLPRRGVRPVAPAAVDLAVHRLVLLAGLLPILIFWVERKVSSKVRREHPDLVPA